MKRMKSNDRAMTLIRALLHGDSGIGKTTSLKTLPPGHTHIYVRERGLVPLRKMEFGVSVLESWADVRQMVTELRKPAEDMAHIRIAACESLTEIGELCKEDIVRVTRPAMLKERSDGKSEKPRGIYDEQMTQEDWGLYSVRMNQFLSAMCHLPVHVVMTALSTHNENKQTGAVLKTPDLNGRIAFECPAYFDLVMHMENGADSEGKPTRVWRTANNGEVLAKDASGELAELEVPDWSAVFKKILGNGQTNGAAPKAAKKEKELVTNG